jgi:hypothetical protein
MTSISRPWPGGNIVQLLAARSGGQFIYASTLLKFIDDEDYRPTDRLEIVLNALGSAALAELDQLYQQILSTVKNIPLLLRILGYVLAPLCQHKFSASDIEDLLDLRDGDVGLTLRRMHSLLRAPDSPFQPIGILHSSFDDFLFSPDRAGKYHVAKDQCHLDMTLDCLCFVKRLTKEPEGFEG